MNVKAANAEALRRLTAAEPVLIDCVPASEAFGLEPQTVLHAGPPIEWTAMSPPVQGAIVGALRYEGWAPSEAAAIDLAARGGLRFEPCHHRGAVGPMAGIVTGSMPVFVILNRAFGNRAYATINEGLGRVLRYGANDENVLARLAWLRDEVGPLLGRALRRKSLDLRPIMAQAVRMGDEMHQRNIAASALLARALFPSLAREANGPALTRFVDFLGDHDQFFLNLAMAAAKAALDPLVGIAGSTVVTTMARNGTEFGIRVAGCGGRWFTAPVNMPQGLYFPGFGPPNGFGLTDLSGSCHEWCLDWYAEGYYRESPNRNPTGPITSARRVSRGGAWRHQNPWSPVAHRSSLPPHLRYSDYGFRVVRLG